MFTALIIYDHPLLLLYCIIMIITLWGCEGVLESDTNRPKLVKVLSILESKCYLLWYVKIRWEINWWREFANDKRVILDFSIILILLSFYCKQVKSHLSFPGASHRSRMLPTSWCHTWWKENSFYQKRTAHGNNFNNMDERPGHQKSWHLAPLLRGIEPKSVLHLALN